MPTCCIADCQSADGAKFEHARICCDPAGWQPAEQQTGSLRYEVTLEVHGPLRSRKTVEAFQKLNPKFMNSDDVILLGVKSRVLALSKRDGRRIWSTELPGVALSHFFLMEPLCSLTRTGSFIAWTSPVAGSSGQTNCRGAATASRVFGLRPANPLQTPLRPGS